MAENQNNPRLKLVPNEGYESVSGDEAVSDPIQQQIDDKLKENQMVPNSTALDLYDLNNKDQAYEGDKHSLIKNIGQLNTKQLMGIVPIVQEFQMQE